MRRCKGKFFQDKKYVPFYGTFHQFGSSYQEFENGAGNYAIAIVELDDGRIITPNAEDIQFTDKCEVFDEQVPGQMNIYNYLEAYKNAM